MHPNFRFKSPPFWDSEPIAFSLKRAFEGFPKDPKWGQGAEYVIEQFKTANRGNIPPPGSTLFQSKLKRTQKRFYDSFMATRFKADFGHDHLRPRVLEHFGPTAQSAGVDLPVLLDTQLLAASLNGLARPSDRFKILKTSLNGWCTSHRLHETLIMPCLFGCPNCSDSFQHYTRCRRLQQLVAYLTWDGYSNFTHIFALMEPSQFQLQRLACVFTGYHELHRHGQKYFAANPPSASETSSLMQGAWPAHWTAFAEAFIAEAGTLSLNVRSRFSVPSFLHFVSTQPQT